MKNIITTAAIIPSIALVSAMATQPVSEVVSEKTPSEIAITETIHEAAMEVANEKLAHFLELNNAFNFEKIDQAFESEFGPARNTYLAVNVIASA